MPDIELAVEVGGLFFSTMNTVEYEEIYSKETVENIKKEFSRLKDLSYLDNAGAALYPESLVKLISNDLIENVYGNPHALNTSSKNSSDIIEQVRERLLEFFGTDSKQYDLIFTSGATSSLKLVIESFDFKNEGNFIYFNETHTSVLGMREIANEKGAKIKSLSNLEVDQLFNKKIVDFKENNGNNLLVYPGQCNFSGRKYNLNWIEEIKKFPGKWYILLDAASLVSTSYLNLSKYKPDFVCISFYKMFGLPTGLGALLINKSAENVLNKLYFGGGTVLMARSNCMKHVPRIQLHERFEDGTVSFLSIIELRHCLDTLENLIPGGMDVIEEHTFRLAKYLYEKLNCLKHYNNKAAVVLYSDSNFNSETTQGPIVNFNLLRANGSFIGFYEVLHMCNLFGIHLRTGCLCNPGACQRFLNLTNEQLDQHFEAGHVCGDSIDIVAGEITGSIRASIGYYNRVEDIEKLIKVIEKCFIETSDYSLKNKELTKINTDKIAKLSKIFLYPIKSCGAQDVSQWPLDSRGLIGDRAWMIVTDAGTVLTQKNEPKMCLIKPTLNLNTKILTLSFPGMSDIHTPFNPIEKDENMSKVCGTKVKTIDCGNDIAEWLTLALKHSGIRLLRQLSTDERTNKKSNVEMSLVNQSQFLLIRLGSLSWLELRTENPQG